MSEKILLAVIITFLLHLLLNLSPTVTPQPSNTQGKQSSKVLVRYGN